jgi:rhamnopyranosyl-N-acetylglucosaminyl-diphospho-decaprenol beta-1,3/1,4-galactofuranosyltransferase
MKVVATLLHYRAWPEVRSTIDAILNQSRPPDALIVVDHASGDGSAERIREAYPTVDVVVTRTNSGPSGGMNHILQAALAADADAWLAVVDDALPAPDALERLLHRLESQPDVGAVGPAADDESRVVDAGGYIVPAKWHIYPRREPEAAELWDGVPPIGADYLQLGFDLVRMEAARDVGTFMQDFYHWGEEADFTIRMRRKGWRLECVPAARNRQHLSPHPSPYLVQRNSLEIIRRNAPRRALIRELVRAFYFIAGDAVAVGAPERRTTARIRSRAVIDFVLRRLGPPPELTTRKD